MIRYPAISWLLSTAFLAAADSPDLLRFTNGDQLHGTFMGFKEGPQAVWQHDDLAAPALFKTAQLRHIVLHGGRPLKALPSLSHLGLVNGNRIPGTITGIAGDTITLDTAFAGIIRIPRNQVSILAPNPLGGRVYYHGPFVEDEWKMTHPAFPDGLADPLPDANANAEDKEEEDQPGRWVFSGSAWYWQNKRAGTALVRETGMPERAVFRFDIAWKNRLSIAIAFHADFAKPKPKDVDEPRLIKGRGFVPGDASELPRLFGNSYVIQLHSSYLMLYRTAVDEDGKPSVERIQLNNNSNNLRLGELSQAKVEIRSNRRTGAIALFVNDEFTAQWNEADAIGHKADPAAPHKGSGFGFCVHSDETPVRISDIIISEWNGMPDSARSLQVDDQDVILMANGTDRFAGKVERLDDQGKVIFKGKHGQFQFPIDEVAEIRFAGSQLAAAVEEPADNVTVRFSPIGSISGSPSSGEASRLGLLSPILGELDLSLESAVMLDLNCSKQPIDDWNADF